MVRRASRLLVAAALLVLPALAAAAQGPAATAQVPAAAQAPDDEALRQAVLAILGRYFDPASVFDVSLVGTAATPRGVAIDDLLVIGRPAVLRGIPADFLLHVAKIELDLSALSRRELRVLSSGGATVVARATARAVQEALAKLSPNILEPQVHFQMGEFVVTAMVRREGRLYPTLVRGRLEVEDGRRVRVRVAQAQVLGGDVPVGLVAGELAKYDPLLDLAQWPLNLRIERLILHNDAVELLLVDPGG